MPSHTYTRAIKNDSGTAVVADPAIVVSGDAEINIGGGSKGVGPGVVAPATTLEIDAPVLVSKLQSLFLTSDNPVDVYTNDSIGATGQHIVLTGTSGGNPSVTWNNLDVPAIVCPLTPTITKWFIKNSGTKPATFRAGFILQE